MADEAGKHELEVRIALLENHQQELLSQMTVKVVALQLALEHVMQVTGALPEKSFLDMEEFELRALELLQQVQANRAEAGTLVASAPAQNIDPNVIPVVEFGG